MKNIFILFFIIISSIVLAQNNPSDVSQLTFKVDKYKGSIDNSPITMLLTFFPDSNITGYYYYDKVGRLFTIKKLKGSKSLKLEAEQIELFNNNNELRDTEIFEFPQSIFENKNNIMGKWIHKGKTHSVNLIKENLEFAWRLFKYKSIGYFKNSPFSVQMKEISIIYPSISSSPKLNAFFLSENYSLDKNTIDFINSSESKYLLIDLAHPIYFIPIITL